MKVQDVSNIQDTNDDTVSIGRFQLSTPRLVYHQEFRKCLN